MRTSLEPPVPPEVRTFYPHLLSEDTIIWSRWLGNNAHRVTGVWYDVHVGEPMTVPAGLHPSIPADALAISRKRIDVVARTPNEFWVIELKPFGNYVALGQALCYSRMFSSEYDVILPVVPLVICCAIDPDLIDDYQRLGVRFEKVGYPPYQM